MVRRCLLTVLWVGALLAPATLAQAQGTPDPGPPKQKALAPASPLLGSAFGQPHDAPATSQTSQAVDESVLQLVQQEQQQAEEQAQQEAEQSAEQRVQQANQAARSSIESLLQEQQQAVQGASQALHEARSASAERAIAWLFSPQALRYEITQEGADCVMAPDLAACEGSLPPG